jgi:ABC-type transport system involved in multi-copper enzyme maturation, permease component
MKLLNMLNLVRNENMKLFKKLGTKVMMLLLILFVLAAAIIIKVNVKSNNDNWKTNLQQQNVQYKQELDGSANQDSAKYAKRAYAENQYRIDHDLPPILNNSLWGFVDGAASLVSLITIFAIIMGSGMVADEYNQGTIKLLLIRPSKRWKIMLSKFISVLLAIIAMLLILFVSSFLIGGIVFGFNGAGQPYLSYANNKIVEVSMVGHLFSTYGLDCVALFMMLSFAFAISNISRNGAMAIGISIGLYFAGSMIVGILSKFDWVKYILFANTDLNQYFDGVPIVKGMTLGFSVTVLCVYFIAFVIISWVGFCKRDVAA